MCVSLVFNRVIVLQQRVGGDTCNGQRTDEWTRWAQPWRRVERTNASNAFIILSSRSESTWWWTCFVSDDCRAAAIDCDTGEAVRTVGAGDANGDKGDKGSRIGDSCAASWLARETCQSTNTMTTTLIVRDPQQAPRAVSRD